MYEKARDKYTCLPQAGSDGKYLCLAADLKNNYCIETAVSRRNELSIRASKREDTIKNSQGLRVNADWVTKEALSFVLDGYGNAIK